MTFAYPWVLLFLCIPAVLAWALVTRRPGLVLPFDGKAHPRRRWLAIILGAFEAVPLLLLASAIVLAARPQVTGRPRSERIMTNIEIVLDVSGSMEDDNKYEMACSAIETFTNAREGDAMGLVIFGGRQIRWIPITKDLAAIRHALPFCDPKKLPEDIKDTLVAGALRYTRRLMDTDSVSGGDRVIILVSDGDSRDIRGSLYQQTARDLIDANIRLYYIHIDKRLPMQREAALIAKATGGDGLIGADPDGLVAVFDYIDHMTRARFREVGASTEDLLRPFALAALALAGTHLLGLFGLRYTPW